MFCPIQYKFKKKELREEFFKNFHKARHHKTSGSEYKFWLKWFDCGPLVKEVIEDLNLANMNINPRYSFQQKNTRLPPHIDIDRIVGININLLEKPAVIHVNYKPHAYECALIDVGANVHSVEPYPTDRLVLKLAIREPWNDILQRLKDKGLVDFNACKDYVSFMTPEKEKQVRI
jgi:hypothetical protein